MPTYASIVRKARALLADVPNAAFDDTYLMEYVGMAQGIVVSELQSYGVGDTRFRRLMVVPAGTKSIGFNPVANSLNSNLLRYSDQFDNWVKDPAVANPPVSVSAVVDPFGNPGAWSWDCAVASPDGHYSQYQMGANSYAASRNCEASASVWVRLMSPQQVVDVTLEVGFVDSATAPSFASTGAYAEQSFKVGPEWQRLFVTYPDLYTPTATVWPAMRIAVDATHGNVKLALFRAHLRPQRFDTTDQRTVNTFSDGELVLPPNLAIPDKLMERRVGGSESEWTMMRGSSPLPTVAPVQRLYWWDWNENQLQFIGAAEDREVMLEYWGALGDIVLGSAMQETEVPIAGAEDAIAYLTAATVAFSNGQSALATAYGAVTPDGITGMAGRAIQNLINTKNKSQQSEPMRRQPAFGVRYPAYVYLGWGTRPW